jgi:hypothetical protein
MKQTKFARRWFPKDPSRATLCGPRELRGWSMFISVCQILLHIAAVVFFLGFFIWPSRMHSFFHFNEPNYYHEKALEDADLDPQDYIHKPPYHFFHTHGHFHMPSHLDQSNPLEKKSNQQAPKHRFIDHLLLPKVKTSEKKPNDPSDIESFMKTKLVEQKPIQPVDKKLKPEFTSPRRTFHMLIFAQKRTLMMRDKDGKLHIGSIIRISPHFILPQQQQQQQQQQQYEAKNVNQPPPMMALESHHHPHHRVARDVGNPSHTMHHGMMHPHFQVKEHSHEHHGFWSSCKQNFKQQFHRRRLVAMILLTLLSLSFCCCLLYGSHAREPLLLLPYLGAQTACFAIYIMWMVNKLFHLSELRLSIAADTHSIFRRQLLSLSQTELVIVFTLGMIFHFLLQLTILAVVWTFYFRLRAERRPKSLNLSYSHRHRRSVSDTAALLYDKVILEEDEDCDLADEKKGEPGNIPRVIIPPPAYVKEEKVEDKKDSHVFVI